MPTFGPMVHLLPTTPSATAVIINPTTHNCSIFGRPRRPESSPPGRLDLITPKAISPRRRPWRVPYFQLLQSILRANRCWGATASSDAVDGQTRRVSRVLWLSFWQGATSSIPTHRKNIDLVSQELQDCGRGGGPVLPGRRRSLSAAQATADPVRTYVPMIPAQARRHARGSKRLFSSPLEQFAKETPDHFPDHSTGHRRIERPLVTDIGGTLYLCLAAVAFCASNRMRERFDSLLARAGAPARVGRSCPAIGAGRLSLIRRQCSRKRDAIVYRAVICVALANQPGETHRELASGVSPSRISGYQASASIFGCCLQRHPLRC